MEVVVKYQGTINEIIGDALLVFFGAPQEMPDRAQQAVACAIEMQNAMARVNERNRAAGLPELQMGIGLNDAEVVVGNIGTTRRSKYAAVGSGVNMTSRIESYTVGGQILVSESVRQAAGEVLRIDGQRDVLPKGSESPLRIYEVGGIGGRFNLALEESVPAFVRLAKPIPLRYAVLEGKAAGHADGEGYVPRLASHCVELAVDAALEPMANLKMNLVSASEALAARDFYGKVIRAPAGTRRSGRRAPHVGPARGGCLSRGAAPLCGGPQLRSGGKDHRRTTVSCQVRRPPAARASGVPDQAGSDLQG